MKKYIIFLTAILIGSIAFAIPDNAVSTNNSQNSTITEPDYTTVKKDNKTYIDTVIVLPNGKDFQLIPNYHIYNKEFFLFFYIFLIPL